MSGGINRRVRRAFDADALKTICEADGATGFTEYAGKFPLDPGKGWRGKESFDRERYYWHQDNGSDILFVAHLDNVHWDPTCLVVNTPNGPLALSGALDDRLGAYVGLELLPAVLGVKFDILLTTDEEIGQTTAADFVTTKDYNWMVSFDRGGTDVVLYEYRTDKLVKLVEASGARVGHGSFSDICRLDDLEIAGFNWGVGYRDYHGPRGHAWLTDTFMMVTSFIRFWNQHGATQFVHKPKVYCSPWKKSDDAYAAQAYGWGWPDDYRYTSPKDHPGNGTRVSSIILPNRCPVCREWLINGEWCVSCGMSAEDAETQLRLDATAALGETGMSEDEITKAIQTHWGIFA